MYAMTTSARSTSSRSTSSRRISVNSRSNGPANTSRSSSRSITRMGPPRLAALPDWPDAHRPTDVGQRAAGDGAGLFGPALEDPLESLLIGPELLVTRAHGREIFDDRLGHGLLERPVPRAVELVLALGGSRPPHRGEDLDQVSDARLLGGAYARRPGVGHGRADL